MGFLDKVIGALRSRLHAEYIRLHDDDGVSGLVVSKRFEGMPTLDRQALIDDALREAPDALTEEEHRRVLMIAGLTPEEYELAGARVRVHRIRELADGSIEVVLHGCYSDALYVRGALNNQKGVETTEPAPLPGAIGVLMRFTARGTPANPLTLARAVRVLQSDRYIQVVQSG